MGDMVDDNRLALPSDYPVQPAARSAHCTRASRAAFRSSFGTR